MTIPLSRSCQNLFLALLPLLAGCGEVVGGSDSTSERIAIPNGPAAIEIPVPFESSEPFNILLVSIDTLRADHLGAYGYARPTSPQIDSFAKESVLFERAYSQAPKTAPSHMTIFTGLYPDTHGVQNGRERESTRMSEAIPTLATLVRNAGWRTEAYTGGGNMRAEFGFAQGFDVFEAGGDSFQRGTRALRKLVADSEEEAPFFLFVHTYSVHSPYLPPPEYRAMFVDPNYEGGVVSDRATLQKMAENSELSGRYGPGGVLNILFLQSVDHEDDEDVRHIIDLYDAGIRRIDSRFGEMLAVLRESGRMERTLVILLSDHGEEFGEHGRLGHSSLHREVLHVPLLFRLPEAIAEARRGVRATELSRLVDVTPSILDLVGLPVPSYVQGQSLFQASNESDGARFVLSGWPSMGSYSLQRGQWKYVVGAKASDLSIEEVYDLGSDPEELQDLRKSVQGKELRVSLRRQLGELQQWCRGLARVAGEASTVETTAEMADELRALGYLGDDE